MLQIFEFREGNVLQTLRSTAEGVNLFVQWKVNILSRMTNIQRGADGLDLSYFIFLLAFVSLVI